MHDGMPYDPIQGQGHGAPEVPKIALFYVYLLRHLQRQLANDHWFLNYSTMSKFGRAGFLLFVQFFVSRDLMDGLSLRIVRPQKSISDFNEIWYVDRAPWVMHVGIPYDPIHSRGVDRQSRTGLI